MGNRIQLDENLLENVAGGAIGFNPDGSGTYTMICEFSRAVFHNVALKDIIEIAKYGANIPNTPEGEQNIINWARSKNYIK